MANRFSYGDTLGGQLYTQYVRDSTNRYLQEKAQEEERQRREAELRRQEEQRKKASDHGAFGQTLQTIGQVGGAIAGGLSTGTPQGAIAGASLGSAGASTIMNLFPNVGGTEPSGDNPYYDKPSDMAKFSSTLNTGLQAYGMYSQAAAARAKEDLMNEIKADMQNAKTTPVYSNGIQVGTSGFDYKNATAAQISDRIKSLPSWQNATGLFGEQLVNDPAALSIANNTYDQISQSAMAGLQFINGLENNKAKQQALQNWQNTYGQSRADLIPKYGLESMQQSVQSGMAKNQYDSQMNQLDMAIKQNQIAAGGQNQAINAQTIQKNEQAIAVGDTAAKEQAYKGQVTLLTAAVEGVQLDGKKIDPILYENAEAAGMPAELVKVFKELEAQSIIKHDLAKTATAQEKQLELFKSFQDALKDMPVDAPGRAELVDAMMTNLDASAMKGKSAIPSETMKAILSSSADYDSSGSDDKIAEALDKDLNKITRDMMAGGKPSALTQVAVVKLLDGLDPDSTDPSITKVKIKRFGSIENFNALKISLQDEITDLDLDSDTSSAFDTIGELFSRYLLGNDDLNLSEDQIKLNNLVTNPEGD